MLLHDPLGRLLPRGTLPQVVRIRTPQASAVGSWFVPRLPEGKTVKNRIHFDCMPIERTRDDEVERIIALGGKLYEDHRAADGRGWVTLRDPEGNEFCVERGEGESRL